MSPTNWPAPPCAPCWPTSACLFFRFRRRRRLLLDCPMPCGMLCASCAGLVWPIWPPIDSGGGGGPWCTSTSGTFCSELMFHFLLLVNDLRFFPTLARLGAPRGASRRWNQAGFEASVETVSSCTRTCVLMHRSRCDQSANCCCAPPGLPHATGIAKAGWNSPRRRRQLWQFIHPTAVCNAFGGSWRIQPSGSPDPVHRNPEQSAEISDLPCNLPPLEKQINRTAIGTHSRFTRQG